MRKAYFSIAGICFSIVDNAGTGVIDLWKKFSITYEKEDFIIKIINIANTNYNLETYPVLKMQNKLVRYENDSMLTDYNWHTNTILPLNKIANINVFTNQIFYSHAVKKHIIQMHSSIVDYNGKGLIFLGPSGIGKTTMAELWNRYRKAKILNGDMTFVQNGESQIIGWGTPWHGSSIYCENSKVSIRALIILKQSSVNIIRELRDFEKTQTVSNNIIYPRWLENGMELCLETLDHLLSKIPVYELSCRPDEEAVELTEKTIFGREN